VLHRRPIAFDLLVAEEVERLRSLAPERDFRFDLERVLPAGDADPDRVAQIVANLVGNAIKYSSGGGPIAITTARAGNAARLDIADEGISIPAEVLPTVFDHDRRVERGAARAVRGSGLRLSIVRQLAHLQRGQAWDDSEEGAGSVFHVTLPLAVPE
jgi:two-component system sensor histidine kinase VicK